MLVVVVRGASLKAQLVFNVLDGNIKTVSFHEGKTPDQAYQEDIEQLLAGTLRLNDLGYFIKSFVQIAEQNAYFLTRFNTQTALFSLSGSRIDLFGWLVQQNESIIEAEFLIGIKKLRSRIIAIRLPQEVADRRRQRAIEKAKYNKKGRTPSARSLALLSWTIFMTNVPAKMLTAQQVAQLL